jgi:hypothetical protein
MCELQGAPMGAMRAGSARNVWVARSRPYYSQLNDPHSATSSGHPAANVDRETFPVWVTHGRLNSSMSLVMRVLA